MADKHAAAYHGSTTHQCARCNRPTTYPTTGHTTCPCGVRHHATPPRNPEA